MISSERIFDTRIDTNKIYVPMKTNFVLRNYKNANKLSPVYLHITSGNMRERINLDVSVNASYWNKETQRLKPVHSNYTDFNLILDNIEAKVTNIKTVYRLSEAFLSPSILKKELFDGLPRVNFCAYFDHALKEQEHLLKKGTYRRHASVLNKLRTYQDEIIFTELTPQWFFKYRKYLSSLGNKSTTINSNFASIKKFLTIAEKQGIKIPCDIDDIKVGSTQGNRTSLNPAELKRIHKFYCSEFILEKHKLVLGYFLFSCLTGLRFSDIMQLKRPDNESDYISFSTKKTSKDQMISLNVKAKEIINACPNLFLTTYTNEFVNRELKKILKNLGYTKKVSFHVARHTFATSFLRMGGRVEKLQILLGHSNIKETMIYVHIVAAEANESIYLLDNLF